MIREMLESSTVKELEEKGYNISNGGLNIKWNENETLVKNAIDNNCHICWDDTAKGNEPDFIMIDDNFDDSNYSGYSILY